MSNGDSSGPGDAVSVFLNEFNFPKLLGGEAGKAISRLIGTAVDIPAAMLDAIAQKTKDKTKAKTVLSEALAKAVAEKAISDPTIVERAMVRMLADETRKQTNREEVAKKAIEYLEEQPASENPNPVQDDWLDYIGSYAEKANSEKMRDLWARILSGEIRNAGSFSLTTLRFMAELDIETAKIVEKYFTRAFGTVSIFHRATYSKSPDLAEVTLLENLGLLNGLGETRNRTLKVETNGFLFLVFRKHAVVIQADPGKEIVLNCLLLTRMGREVISILTLDDDLEEGKIIAASLPKENVIKISWYPIKQSEGLMEAVFPENVLWEQGQTLITS
jgi:Protein of unknown function (DUF2806)